MALELPPVKVKGQLMGAGSALLESEEARMGSPEFQPTAVQRANEVAPAVRADDASRRSAERAFQEENPTPSFFESSKLAVSQEWMGAWALKNNELYAPDPDFTLTPELVKELGEGIDPKYWDFFEGAHSADHALALRKRLQTDIAEDQALASKGYTGIFLRLAAAVSDPVAWGVGATALATTGGVGTVAIAGKKLSKMQHIVRTGLAGGVSNGAIEAYIYSQKPTGEALNILYGAGLGMGIGGAVGAFAKNPYTRAEADAFREIGKKTIHEAEQRAVAEEARATGQDPRDLGVEERFIDGADLIPDDSAGAMRTSRKESLDESIEDFVERANKHDEVAPRTAFGKWRFGAVAKLKSSSNPLTRLIGGNIAEDGVGNADRGVATAIGATERQTQMLRRNEVAWRQAYEPSFREYFKRMNDGNWKPFQKDRARGEFNELVTRYVRDPNPVNYPPEVMKVGNEYRRVVNDLRKLANQPGAERGIFLRALKGFGTLEENANYVNRVFDNRKLDDMIKKYGDNDVRRMIAGALRSKNPEMDVADAMKAAKAYLKTIRRLRVGIGQDANRALNSGDAEEIKAFLRDNMDDISDVEIEDMVDALTIRQREGGISQGKHRMDFDESFSMNLRGETVSVNDLFVNDIEQLFNSYNRQMTGAIAMAQMVVTDPKTGEKIIDGITSRAEWDSLMAKTKAAGDQIGQDTTQLKSELTEMDYLYRSVMGIPRQGDEGNYAQALKALRDYNFSRVMGQVGWAQIPEIGVVLGTLGFKALIRDIPTFKTLWRNAKSGKLDDELMDEMEGIWGIGSDWLRGGVVNRWDDLNGAPDGIIGNNKFLNKATTGNQKLNRFVGAGSGMSTVNTILQRWTAKAIAHKFEAMTRNPSVANRNRMKTLGLDDKMLDRILGEYKANASVTDGLMGRKVNRMNVDKWEDMEAAAAFKDAVFRWSRRIVQENDPGLFREWMSRPSAKSLLQFRTFMLGAYEKLLLHNMHMRDFETFSIFMGTSFAASMGYIGQTYVQSIGRGDREEFLNDRLSAKSIGLATFQRAGYASILPTIMDAGAMASGQDPLFDFRTTGQGSGLILGNPNSGLIFDDIPKATGGIVDSLVSGRSMSQAEVRNAARILPLQNIMPIQQLLNYTLAESGLPQRAPK